MGNLAITEAGAWTYRIDNSLIQYLGKDVTKVETFTVKSIDGTASQDIRLTLTGVNDVATINGNATAFVVEDAATPMLQAIGSLTVADVDAGENKFRTLVDSTSGNLGSLTITDSGQFVYNVDNTLVQYLGAGQSKVETFTVHSVDGTASQAINITIQGVNDAPIALAASIASQEVQYSDGVEEIVFRATDADFDVLTGSIAYSYNGAPFIDGLPDAGSLAGKLSFTSGADPNTWTLNGLADLAPGEYKFRFRAADAYASSDSISTVVVKPEDAIASAIGQPYFSSDREGNFVMTLRSVIEDVSNLVSASDLQPGLITQSSVQFKVNGQVVGSAPVVLVNQDNKLVGIAQMNWSSKLKDAQTPQSYQVDTIVNGFYTNEKASSYDDYVVTVAPPTGEFISGGGFMVSDTSSGKYAADDGTKFNFGFNIKWNKQFTNLLGNFTGIFRRQEQDGSVHTYQIKSNATDSLAVQPNATVNGAKTDGTAVFRSKASLIDITDSLNPISLGGNLNLEVGLRDFGEPGHSDQMQVNLWSGGSTVPSGSTLLFSSSSIFFDDGLTFKNSAFQTIAGGNLDVQSSRTFG